MYVALQRYVFFIDFQAISNIHIPQTYLKPRLLVFNTLSKKLKVLDITCICLLMPALNVSHGNKTKTHSM